MARCPPLPLTHSTRRNAPKLLRRARRNEPVFVQEERATAATAVVHKPGRRETQRGPGTHPAKEHPQLQSTTYLAEVDVDFREAERVEADVSRHGPVQVLRLRHEGDRLAVGHAERARGRSHSAVHRHGCHEGGRSRHERGERGKGGLHGTVGLV